MDNGFAEFQHHGDHVKTDCGMRYAVTAVDQPFAGSSTKVDLFGMRHGFLWNPVMRIAAGFDLNEYDGAIRCHHYDVEFAITGMPVAAQRAPSLAFEPRGCIVFAESSELFWREGRISHGRGQLVHETWVRLRWRIQHGLVEVRCGFAAGFENLR